MGIYKFKSKQPFFDKERFGIKNNTVRKIDLQDNRFLDLIAHTVAGYNDGDIKIEIISAENPSFSFTRNIKDISIFEDFMIITWAEEGKGKGGN